VYTVSDCPACTLCGNVAYEMRQAGGVDLGRPDLVAWTRADVPCLIVGDRVTL
jgi:hypothetical protein